MSKPIIAIDIDDVLAVHAASFVRYSNEKWGTNLRVEDYDEHWATVWKVDMEETERRAVEYHASGVIGQYDHYPEALHTLQQLAQNYRLIVATSRRAVVRPETEAWLTRCFPGVFDEVCFVGIYDGGLGNGGAFQKTKLDLLQDKGAEYLIDDQLKHCVAVAEAGLNAVLFGDYSWNQMDALPERIVRCKDWAAVLEYFEKVAVHA